MRWLPALEMFKKWLDIALSALLQLTRKVMVSQRLDSMTLEVFSQHYDSVILFQMGEYNCSNAMGRAGREEKRSLEKVLR